MNSMQELDRLYQLALAFRFAEFSALFARMEREWSADERAEALLMRAQIKLFATDLSLVDDLDEAGQSGLRRPGYPSLTAQWHADAPNRFIIFPEKPGALPAFLRTLCACRERLGHWYGGAGEDSVRLIQAEIQYFRGEWADALTLTEAQDQTACGNHTEEMLAQCTRFRCNLALGQTREAEQGLMDLYRLSRTYPECLGSYEALRSWANMTTSWNGDMPRFYQDARGERCPVLVDRLEGIRQGTARNTPLEEPFVQWAGQNYDGAYALRHHYMVLFHAMFWLEQGDDQQTRSYFHRFYHMTQDTGICMPLIECGEQVAPLLRYVRDSGMDCDPKWLAEMAARAAGYERSLDAYRA